MVKSILLLMEKDPARGCQSLSFWSCSIEITISADEGDSFYSCSVWTAI